MPAKPPVSRPRESTAPSPPPVRRQAPARETGPDAAGDSPTVPKLERLSGLLNADGTLAVDRMHGDTKAKFAAVLADPRTAQALGVVTSGEAPKRVDTFPPFLIPVAIDALNRLTLIVAAKAVTLPIDRLDELTRYTDSERDQLAEPLATCLNKYGGKWLSKWGAEFALLTAFGVITYAKLDIATREERAAKTKPAWRAPATVTPVPTPDPVPSAAVDVDISATVPSVAAEAMPPIPPGPAL
jgi:hypothetical protein